MRHEKPKIFPLLMLESYKKKLSTRAMRLEVNRSWLTRLFIDYGYRSMTDSDILQFAETERESKPHRDLSR